MTVKPLVQPEGSELSTFNAAQWNVKIVDESGDLLWLNGLTKFEPSQDQTMQDDTDIFSRGYKSQQVTATSEDVSIEGLIKGPKSLGVAQVDPGLAYLRSKRQKVGEANVVTLVYWRADTLQDYATQQNFAVGWKDVGGSQEDLQKFTADLKGRGAPKQVPVPSMVTKKLVISGTATSITVTVDGQATSAVTTINAANIQAAIEALSNVDPGDAEVTSTVANEFIVSVAGATTITATVVGSGATVAVSDPA